MLEIFGEESALKENDSQVRSATPPPLPTCLRLMKDREPGGGGADALKAAILPSLTQVLVTQAKSMAILSFLQHKGSLEERWHPFS